MQEYELVGSLGMEPATMLAMKGYFAASGLRLTGLWRLVSQLQHSCLVSQLQHTDHWPATLRGLTGSFALDRLWYRYYQQRCKKMNYFYWKEKRMKAEKKRLHLRQQARPGEVRARTPTASSKPENDSWKSPYDGLQTWSAATA